MSRKIDLSSFRGDSDDEDYTPRNKALELNELKSRTFSHGITKKSKRDLEREAEERKKQAEDEAAAKALAEFEDAFDGPAAGPSGGFGRGMGGGFVRAGGAPLAVNLPSQSQMPAGSGAPPRGPAAMGYARPHRPMTRAPSPPPGATKPKGKRAMDSFLQEIKGNQAAREQRLGKTAQQEGSSVSALAAWENASGRQMFNEQESTNLFVGNVPGTVTEDTLGRFFAEIGPVGSAKIMWPRSELEMENVRRGKQSLTGFVAYMKRKDAETAVSELDGAEWGGAKLKVGFSKPVPIPQRAVYDLGKGASTSRKRSRSRSPARRDWHRSRSRSPGPARHGSRSPPKRARRASLDSTSTYSRSPSPRREKPTAREKWLAKVPEEQAKFIRAVADRVREHGRGFEDSLREKERSNPKFAFFFDDKIPDYHLYRSKMSSRYRIPTPPPEDFEDEGYASMYSSDSAEDSEKERTEKGKIGRLAKKRFEAMLRSMSGKRAEIGRAMEFAMKKAEAADDVTEIICQSLQLDSTPVPRKLARLHLVSDILHNAASPLPNVWKYKFAFEKRLPDVFAHFKSVYDSLHAYSGNISADVFRNQVAVVLDVWERWMAVSQDVQDLLRDYLSGARTPGQAIEDNPHAATMDEVATTGISDREQDDAPMSGFKKSGFKSSFKPIAIVPAPVPVADEDLDGEVMDGGDDLDGEAMGDDLDGEAMDGGLDGEALEEDLDGEAF